MPDKTTEQRVREIVVNQLNVMEEQATPDASFVEDLGADSLDLIELVFAFEEEFKAELKAPIGEADAAKLRTVGDVVAYIDKPI
jgi:acyl carrier protein